jgi:hypothetical protein
MPKEVQDFETSLLGKRNFLNVWTNSLLNPNMERQTGRGITVDTTRLLGSPVPPFQGKGTIKPREVQDFETSPSRKGNFLNVWTNSLLNPNMERQISKGTTTDNPLVGFPSSPLPR